MNRVILSVVLAILPLTGFASPVKDWSAARDGLRLHDAGGTLCVEVLKNDMFRILYFPQGQDPCPVRSASVVKYDWSTPPFDVRESDNDILLSTSTHRVRISKPDGILSFEDQRGQVLLSELDGSSRILEPCEVLGERTWHAEQRFSSPEDEAIYGLGQFHEGIMDFKDYFLRLKQFNTVIALPFFFSTKGYGLFWNNSSLTEWNPEKIELEHQIQASWDYEWALFEPEEDGEYIFIVDGLGRNASVYVDIDELCMEDGFEKRISRRIINQDYDVIPSCLAGRVSLEKGKTYELNIKADFKNLYVRTPSMSGKSTLRSEVADVIDYFVMLGSPDKAISDLRELTGEAPLFPQWAYGFNQSRYTYDTEEAMLAVADGYRSRHYPLDVVVQDMNYWEVSDERNTWGSHLFDPQKFPNPEGMYKKLHDDYKVHVLISVWPRINRDADLFDYFVENGYSLGVQNTASKSAEGISIIGEQDNVAIDPYNPEARKAYWHFMKERLWDKGVDGWWLDASEPEWGYDFRISKTFAGSGARNLNTYSLMQTGAIYDGQRGETDKKRVVILTRSAFPGQQRYGTQCWSGDIGITWNTFRQQLAAGLNYSMAGMPYWSSDIGGFRPFMKTHSHEYRELVVRWFQFGTFLPVMRVHGCRSTELWNLDKESEAIQVAYDRFRHRMLPYIYSLADRVTSEGYTIHRGIVMDYPDDPATYRMDDQFMMGSALMVCPVTEYRSRSREVYLPGQGKWFDFWSGHSFDGGSRVRAEAPIEQIPIFVPAGTILPLGEAVEYAGERPADLLEVRIYPGADGSFTLYEDENDGYGYEKGRSARIVFHWDNAGRTLTIDKPSGSFPGMLKERRFRVTLVGEGKAVGMEAAAGCDRELVYRNKQIKIRL